MVDVRDAPTCDIELNATFENQQPLTLALSRRERGLTAVDVRDTLTEIPSRTRILKSPKIGSLSLRERAGVRANPLKISSHATLLTTQQ
ncbi:hypothetical protein SAMN05216496_2761 [Pseudomonas sp. Z003-0.4C(8344-21)]|nr:hypothetical protein SAMN05216496_2761 [Pseudomonas sp. Z003-0.4C(8344-21)]